MAQLPLSHRPRQPSPSALSPAWKSSTGFCGRRASGRTARRAPQRASAARNRSGKTKRRRKLRDEAARRSGKTKGRDAASNQRGPPGQAPQCARQQSRTDQPPSQSPPTPKGRGHAQSVLGRHVRAQDARARGPDGPVLRPVPPEHTLSVPSPRDAADHPRHTSHTSHPPKAIPPRQFPRGNSPGGISAQRQSRQRRPPRCLPPSPPLPACFSIPAKPSASQPSSRPRATTRYPIPPPTPLHSQCAA